MGTLTTVLRRNLMTALGRRQLDEADALLSRLRADAPFDRETRALELEFLVRRDRIDEAIALGKALCGQFPDSAFIFHWSGQAAYRARRYADAEALFRESARIAPRQRNDWWLGKTLTQLGRFDEAEALLVPLVKVWAMVGKDVAWLYERMGQSRQALIAVETYLAAYPEPHPAQRMAREQRLRLRARATEPEALIAEVDSLVELGEAVEVPVLVEYVEALMNTAQGPKARAVVRERLESLAPAAARTLGWNAHRRGAFDMAFEAFAVALPAYSDNESMHKAVDWAAARTGRQSELRIVLERCLAAHPNHESTLAPRIERLKRLGARGRA